MNTAGQSGKSVIEEKVVGDFKLSIYLPPDYNKATRYKILYFNDGQTVFGSQGLNADGTADELIVNKLIEPIIIVGIHSDINRNSNYIPYFDEGAKQDFGDYTPKADKYTKKIIKQIIPFIEKQYNTHHERGIAGYSFGGLHATWAALNYPEEFIFSGSLSPSYWVNDFKIFQEGSKAKKTQTYYFDIGTGEWNYYVPMLLHCKLPMLQNAFYYEDSGARHSVKDWRGVRIKNMLLLFAGKTDLMKYTWEVKQEIIRSNFNGKYYPRINPVISYSNGLTCSLSYAATFSLLNPDDGIVYKDGSFSFIHPKDLMFRISFNGEEKYDTVKYTGIVPLLK